jgi:hypothetical protein
VQRVFIAYTVDLILVLRELFDFALQRTLFGCVTYDSLQEAFERFHRTQYQAQVHSEITALVKQHEGLSADSNAIHEGVAELLRKHSGH